MNELGKNIGNAFLPSYPTFDDLLKKGGLNGGFEGLKNTTAGKMAAEAIESPNAELKRSYVRVFSGTASPRNAQDVLEDLLNQTLRRAMVAPEKGMTMEQLIPYMVERHGQNGMMIYMLKMIQDGRDLPAPQTATKKRRK